MISHIIGAGHQPNSRGLYTHSKDSILKVGWPSPIRSLDLIFALFRNTTGPCPHENGPGLCSGLVADAKDGSVWQGGEFCGHPGVWRSRGRNAQTYQPPQTNEAIRNLKRENDSKGNESSTPSIFRRYVSFQGGRSSEKGIGPIHELNLQWSNYWGITMKLAAVNHVYHCLWRRVNLDISRSSGWFGACLICKKNVSAKHTFICHHTCDNRPHWYTWCICRRILHANDITGHDCGR